ncbi:MAG: hypothetical protein COX77_04895 [Candidatus Komeilibacteria bacterium CG_4_10_14_0_2_um_filter_37_10]|uniref:Uncharacterized protein n=1 Tax=Candidatus Komeilibacteria bacterium CG_4_10_14_0_2_um_filter_37_10 TaxID=1974470 RepID=A0A2M7VD25_9BACT|nr:MAG: hypothetical protein COX77_04895 [Candidatus Komeilibacteria bacterium CG_4_10_14_0_2_um_filter_37_10]
MFIADGEPSVSRLTTMLDRTLHERLDCEEEGALTFFQLLYWWCQATPGSGFAIYLQKLTDEFFQWNKKEHPNLIAQLYFDGLFTNSARSEDGPDEIISWLCKTVIKEFDFVSETKFSDFPTWLVDIFSWPVLPLIGRTEVVKLVDCLKSKAQYILMCNEH